MASETNRKIIVIAGPVNTSTPGIRIAARRVTDTLTDVLNHPLAAVNPKMRVTMKVDEATGVTAVESIDMLNADKASWVYLAVLIRPFVFSQREPTYVLNLLRAIDREHEGLRSATAPIREAFKSWKNTLLMRLDILPGDYVSTGRIQVGEPGTVTDCPPGSRSMTDTELTDLVLNGYVWHSDHSKARQFQEASPMFQQAAMKAAEVRTVAAIPTIKLMGGFITAARDAGYDF